MTAQLNSPTGMSIVVFSGAGISVSAGLSPYRGAGGLWNDPTTARASQAENVTRFPALCWEHWGNMRARAHAAQPTAAHIALAEAEARLPEGWTFNILTQNIDGLHTKAGSKNVIEFHGHLFTTRCSNARCSLEPFTDHDPHFPTIPHCSLCGSVLRPGLVMFGDMIDQEKHRQARKFFAKATVLIVVGSSLEVYPAKNLVRDRVYSKNCRSIWVNPQPPTLYRSAYRPEDRRCRPADEVLPSLMDQLVPRT
jgi:NAD-dependent deacetylase